MHYKKIDKDFLGQAQNIPVLEKLINYVDSQKFSDEDLQRTEKVQSLLMHSFANNKVPDDDCTKSVQKLFLDTKFSDFKEHLYRHSDCVATYLWVDQVQEIVTHPLEKARMLKGNFVECSTYKLFCFLRNIKYEPRNTWELSRDQNVKIFKNILKCVDRVSEDLKNFVNGHFQETLSEKVKDEITEHTRKFLEDRITKFKKSRTNRGRPRKAGNKPRTSVANDPVPCHQKRVDEQIPSVQNRGESATKQTENQVTRPSAVKIKSVLQSTKRKAIDSPQKKKNKRNKFQAHNKNTVDNGLGDKSANFQKLQQTPEDDDDVIIIDDEEKENSGSGTVQQPSTSRSHLVQAPPPPMIDLSVIQEPEAANPEVTHSHNFRISDNRNLINRNILDMFEKQWQDQEFCDVTLISSCGSRISAHKFVLAAGSPVFSRSLKDASAQGKEIAICLRNTSFEVLKEMLRFIYSGKVEKLDYKSVPDLLAAAHKYEIGHLKDLCREFMKKGLNDDNAIATLKLSKTYGLDDLRAVAEEFILRQIKN